MDSSYDILFNCCGLSAPDKKFRSASQTQLVPEQNITVIAPWVKIAIFIDSDTYVIPGINGEVTMGGPILGEHSVRERCEQVLPSLKSATVLRESVALRSRPISIRVESELLLNPETNQTLKVIHNYGHGAVGVSLSPGTAEHAVRIAKSLLASK